MVSNKSMGGVALNRFHLISFLIFISFVRKCKSTKLSTSCRIKIKNMSFRKTLFYTKNKASEAFSWDSNYEFDFMPRIKEGLVFKSG